MGFHYILNPLVAAESGFIQDIVKNENIVLFCQNSTLFLALSKTKIFYCF